MRRELSQSVPHVWSFACVYAIFHEVFFNKKFGHPPPSAQKTQTCHFLWEKGAKKKRKMIVPSQFLPRIMLTRGTKFICTSLIWILREVEMMNNGCPYAKSSRKLPGSKCSYKTRSTVAFQVPHFSKKIVRFRKVGLVHNTIVKANDVCLCL